MHLLSLDLEMNQPSGRIIQIGFTIVHLHTRETLLSKRIYVRCGEILDPRIIQLTGITQEQCDAGITLEEAYSEVYYWHQLYQCYMNPITWGGGDSYELKKQLFDMPHEEWCFGRRWLDVKTLYIAYCLANGRPVKAGLKKASNAIGHQFVGPAHDAERDAWNTAQVFFKLLDIFNKVGQGQKSASNPTDTNHSDANLGKELIPALDR